MMRRTGQLCLLLTGLASSVSFAQRAGGSRPGGQGGGGGKPTPQQTAMEQSQAQTAKEWADVIEKLRAKSPPAPLPTIRFATPNELLLSRLRWAEDPKHEVAVYLDKLWKDGKEPIQRRIAMETFWHDAEKPKWVRPAIEEYFRVHANGAALRPPEEPADMNKAAAAPAATAPATPGAPAAAPAPAPATPPPATAAAADKP
jgi:hypothetical protein